MEDAIRRLIISKASRGLSNVQISSEVQVSRSTIYRVLESGTADRAPDGPSGDARRSSRTPELVQNVREQIMEKPRQSIRSLARFNDIPETSMR